MSLYRWFFRTVLVRLDAETVHHHVIAALRFAGRVAPLRFLVSRLVRRPSRSFAWPVDNSGRRVAGPLGLAAGMDKEALAVPMWNALGFGFVEIGTITPLAQPGNEKPRLWRLPQQRALRNAMGFNNSGALVAARRLKKLRRQCGDSAIIGANIGKNKLTPAAKAPGDYRKVTRSLARLVDFLVINVSSPNTPGLRDLQAVESLRPIIQAVQRELATQALTELPVFVKIAPDLADDDIVKVAHLAQDLGLRGVVATNTTIKHNFGAGGVSGQPLKERSLEVVRLLRQHLGTENIIIGVGGISTVADARAMLQAGADLIEGLSAFVYEGPTWAARLNRELSAWGPVPEEVPHRDTEHAS